MTRRGRASLALLLLSLLILGTLGAWRFLFSETEFPGSMVIAEESAPANTENAVVHTTRQGTAHDATPDPSNHSSPLVENNPDFEGTGRVHLTVLDEETEQPVADLPFLLFSERPTNHVLASGVTDSNGQAWIDKLPEDVVLIETARRPPYAVTLSALWLPDGGEETVTHRLARGGVLKGRVIDDLGQPLEDISIQMVIAPGSKYLSERGMPEEVTRSGTDGRFEITAVASRARGVWVVDGKARPERLEPVPIGAQRAPQNAWVTMNVQNGQVKELPDLVLPRPYDLQGRLKFADGQPAVGWLVSTSRERFTATRMVHSDKPRVLDLARVPGDPAFSLGTEEALTDGGGAFHFDSFAQRGSVLMRGPHGEMATARIDYDAYSRDTPARWDHTLPPLTLVYAHFHLPDGTRYPDQELPSMPRLSTDLAEGSGESVHLARLPDQGFVATVADPPETVTQVTASVWNLQPDGVRVDGLRDRQSLAFTLRSRTELALRLRLIPAASSPKGSVWMAACVAAPAQRVDVGAYQCCGLGGVRHFDVEEQPREVEIPVTTHDSYWLHVYEQQHGPPASFGPFAPGEVRHEIPLPPLTAADATAKEEEPKQPPPAELELPAQFRVVFLDDATGDPVPKSSVLFWIRRPGDEVDEATPNRSWGRLNEQGRMWTQVEPGDGVVEFEIGGYERPKPIPFQARSDQETDLGVIRLIRQTPRLLRGRVLDATGTPLNAKAQIVTGDWMFSSIEEDGSFEVPVPPGFQVPAEYQFHVTVRGGGGFLPGLRAYQAVVVPSWPLDQRGEVHLRPWRDVEIRVHGIPQRHAAVGLNVSMKRASEPGPSPWGLSVLRAANTDAEIRTYRARVVAGHYHIQVGGVLYRAPDRAVEVLNGTEPMVFEFTVQ